MPPPPTLFRLSKSPVQIGLKKSCTLQDIEKTTEKSSIVYLRVFKDPADNANTMQKVLDFLSEMFDVGKVLKHLVVVRTTVKTSIKLDDSFP